MRSSVARRFKVLLRGWSHFCSGNIPKCNAALFGPLTRIENAGQRASNIMLTASNLPPRENELIARGIQEKRDALEPSKLRSRLER
jgi:hypothetical protein